MAAMIGYMPANASPRDPALLRREARDTHRGPGFFADQQI
jgi:hypothetical protein